MIDPESNGGYQPPIVGSQVHQPIANPYPQMQNQPNYMQQAHQLTVQQQPSANDSYIVIQRQPYAQQITVPPIQVSNSAAPQQVIVQHQYAPQPVVVHHPVITAEQQKLAATQKTLKKWSKCHLYSGYAWTFFNGINVVCNAFLIFIMFSWHDITFFDQNGTIHTLKLNSGGLIFLTLLKIVACVMCVKWGLEAIKIFKPIIQSIDKEQIQGVQAEGHIHDSQSKQIKQHKKKVVKILGFIFLIMIVSILYGKSYVSNFAMRFIDDEYDYMEKTNSTTPFEPMWVDNSDEWDFTNQPQPAEDPSQNEDGEFGFTLNVTSARTIPSVLVSQMAIAPPAQFTSSFRGAKHGMAPSAQMPPRPTKSQNFRSQDPEMLEEPRKSHGRKEKPNRLGNDQGFGFEVEASFGTRNANGKQHHGRARIPSGPWDDIFNVDYSKVSREDLKHAAQTLINSMAVMIFVWGTVMFALFSGLVVFCLKKVKKASKAHHACVLAMLPQIEQPSFGNNGYDVHPSGTGHSHRAANGMDFERVAVSEPADDRIVAPNTYSINAANIPQTVIIPRNFAIN